MSYIVSLNFEAAALGSIARNVFTRVFISFFSVLVFWGCKSRANDDHEQTTVSYVRPQIIKELPHDTSAFTQGLVFHQGYLYESTGLYGQSNLRKIDTASGKVVQSVPVPKVFAEGIAIAGNRIVQLTWRAGIAITYSLADFTPLGTIRYSGEGWGLTRNNGHFIMSNGTDTLTIRDKEFRLLRALPVTLKGKPLTKMNELEYARDVIFANVWYSDYIFVISPENGKVKKVVNCSELVEKQGTLPEENVLNGIAYNPDSKLFYITGKRWKTIYVVSIPF